MRTVEDVLKPRKLATDNFKVAIFGVILTLCLLESVFSVVFRILL